MRQLAGVALAIVATFFALRSAMADDLMVKIVSAPTAIHAGDQITITVETEPRASCSGNVEWKAMKGQGHSAVPLAQRTANSNGQVTWSWKAGEGPAANGQILVTCQNGDKNGKASAELTRR